MERMLVVVFDNETKAYEGSSALTQLDSEGSISIHAKAEIKKNANGTITGMQEGDDFPIRTVAGTSLGALIGVLGGPAGVGIGAAIGFMGGTVGDLHRAGVNAEFVDDVSAKLAPGKWAVVSDISEEWVTPVDTRMESLGGTVFRMTRHGVQHEQDARDVAAMKADISELKAEHAKSRAEHKAKLQAKIDKLRGKLKAKREQAKKRSEQEEEEAKAKVQALEKKAAKSKGETKAKIEARIAEIKKKSKESKERFKQLFKEDEPV